MDCPQCGEGKAQKHTEFGILPCKVCQNEGEKVRPGSYVEFTTDRIKGQRKEYRKDIIQPYRDGVLSKEYIEEYGTSGIKATDKEIKNAKYTYKDTPGWWNRRKSKGGRSTNS